MSLLGWGTLALGAVSAYQGYKASENSADATAAATATSNEALAFQKEQYARVQEIYGSTEENLSSYYNSLTPEKYETMGLDAYDAQYKQAESSWSQTMAQRGISGSGIEAEGALSMQTQGTQDRATISANADSQWAADQMSWLGLGMGQESVAAQGIAGAQANMTNLYSNQSNMYSQQASSAGTGVGSLISGAMYANAYNPGSVNLDIPDFNWGGNTSNVNSQSSWNMYNGTIRK